jgi:soluble lytic murein transglycosylase-like protein
MESKTLAVLAVLTVATVWALAEMANTAPAESETDTTTSNDETDGASLADELTSMARQTFNMWRPPEKYALLIATAEARHGLPQDILARLLYQECRWRDDIISGRLKSPAGAVGIAQFMPATAAEWGVNPLDPASAIDGAARYLASLYRKFGTWTQALAAYNWGQGNVARKGLGMAPTETRNYYSQILADVNAANGSNLA